MPPNKKIYVQSLNESIHEMLEEDESIVVLGEDILSPYGGAFKVTKGLSDKYPNRVISTPISEQAITGLAVGLALNGHKPILEIMFGDFITLSVDQIINHAAKFSLMYSNDNFRMVIRTPMGGYRGYGPTHSQSIEKILLGIPGVTVIAPSIFHNPGLLLKGAIDYGKGPVIFIENKILYSLSLVSELNGYLISNCHSKLAPTIKISPASRGNMDLTIVTYGGISWLMEDVLNYLMENEISVETFIYSDISNPDISELLKSAHKSKRILFVSEQARGYGFAAELIARLTESKMRNVDVLG